MNVQSKRMQLENQVQVQLVQITQQQVNQIGKI